MQNVKLLEDNRGGCLCDLGLGKVFLDMMPIAGPIKERPDKLDFIQVETFFSVEETLKRMKGQVF